MASDLRQAEEGVARGGAGLHVKKEALKLKAQLPARKVAVAVTAADAAAAVAVATAVHPVAIVTAAATITAAASPVGAHPAYRHGESAAGVAIATYPAPGDCRADGPRAATIPTTPRAATVHPGRAAISATTAAGNGSLSTAPRLVGRHLWCGSRECRAQGLHKRAYPRGGHIHTHAYGDSLSEFDVAALGVRHVVNIPPAAAVFRAESLRRERGWRRRPTIGVGVRGRWGGRNSPGRR